MKFMKLNLETLSGLLTLGVLINNLERGAQWPHWLARHLTEVPVAVRNFRLSQSFDTVLFIFLVVITIACWVAFYRFFRNPLQSWNWRIFLVVILLLMIDAVAGFVLSLVYRDLHPGLITGLLVLFPLSWLAIRKMMAALIVTQTELWRRFVPLSVLSYTFLMAVLFGLVWVLPF